MSDETRRKNRVPTMTRPRTIAAAATIVLGGAGLAGTAPAADAQAGADLAGQCVACHGPAGVSTSDDIPNLAAQKSAYLQGQLTAFRSGDRSNALMNAIAASLSDADIENLAAHFSALPGAEPGAVAENVSGLDGSLPSFPADYAKSFTRYQSIEFEDRKQVRHYWGNEAALKAAAAGEDFPDGAYLLVEIFGAETDDSGKVVRDDDGAFVQTELTGFTAMEKQPGWGDEVPDIVANGDWRYAVYTADGQHRDGVGEAGCLACHKPLTDTDYSFTYEAMAEFE